MESRVTCSRGYHLLCGKKDCFLSEAALRITSGLQWMSWMESLVEAYGSSWLELSCTGMGRDGSDGMAMIKERRQDNRSGPRHCCYPGMPEAI